jgi:putative FmdB family regulatory protein
MPAYDYACRACGHHVELTHRISDPPVTTCPACGAETLERLVSPSSFTLRGGGWYADGYGAKAAAGPGDAKPKAAEAPKAEAPAAAPAPKADGGSTS